MQQRTRCSRTRFYHYGKHKEEVLRRIQNGLERNLRNMPKLKLQGKKILFQTSYRYGLAAEPTRTRETRVVALVRSMLTHSLADEQAVADWNLHPPDYMTTFYRDSY